MRKKTLCPTSTSIVMGMALAFVIAFTAHGAEGGLINVKPLRWGTNEFNGPLEDHKVVAITKIVDILNESPDVFTAYEALAAGKGYHLLTFNEFNNFWKPFEPRRFVIDEYWRAYEKDRSMLYAILFNDEPMRDAKTSQSFYGFATRPLDNGREEFLVLGAEGYLALIVESLEGQVDWISEARLVRYGEERGLVARFRYTGQADRFAYCLYDKPATASPSFNPKGTEKTPEPSFLVDSVVLYYTAEGITRFDLSSPAPYSEFGSYKFERK